MRVTFYTLGCKVNQNETGALAQLFEENGYTVVSNEEGADVYIVNSCTVTNFGDQKSRKWLRRAKRENPGAVTVLTGCYPQAFPEEAAEIAEADVVTGSGNRHAILADVQKVLNGEEERVVDIRPHEKGERFEELPMDKFAEHTRAFVKVEDGCNRRCAYCVIPSLRGKFRSRTKESILEEARLLAASGVKELIIVAQDITRYGIDLYGKVCLTELLKELCKLDFRWVRLHYLYPELIDDELIDEIASEDKIVKYLDIPIQHINDTILRRMNRRGTGEEIRALFKKLRERIPGLVLRTSLITGLPGEGEAEFEELCDFLREAKIERAGVFPYSPEEGTPAALMPDRCSTEEAQRRAELCMEIQAEIMDGFAETFIGRELDVLVMGREPDGTPWGRSEYDSPDIDSRVIFSGDAAPGDMVRVRIDSVDDGELIGEQI